MCPSHVLERFIVATLLGLAACSASGDAAEVDSSDELTSSDPRSWGSVEELAPAAGAYLLRSPRDMGALAKCPRYAVVTVEADKRRVLFEERPLYYDLAPSFVEGLRDHRYSGMLTQSYEPARSFGTTVEAGVIEGPTSPQLGSGTAVIAITKPAGADRLRLHFSVEDPARAASAPGLACDYERTADSVKQMAPGVIAAVQSSWTDAKKMVASASAAQIDVLCKSITTHPFWSGGAWSRGLCDGLEAAANRSQLVAALDAALESLAKERRGLTDPSGAYGGPTDGAERLYRVDTRRAVFGGFAPTELYADELEVSVKAERCAAVGLTEVDCKLHAAIKAAFATRYHDE